MPTKETLADAVSRFGTSLKAKLSSKGAVGAPEDQLRAPLETLIADLATILAFKATDVVAIGESSLSALKTRPDYAVTVSNALVGFIEVKAPGKGADPRKFKDEHDRKQWDKLKSLPNLIYTDGNAFSLWRDGKLSGELVKLQGDVETSGAKLTAPPGLQALMSDFLRWKPVPPTSPRALAEVSAKLCRLLRDEVAEQLELGTQALTGLADDWRRLLFPEADDEQFADGYAQAVTFGLLMARAQGITLANRLDQVARALAKTNTVIGAAFRILTDDVDSQEALKTSLGTLTRVLDAVDWAVIGKGDPEAWLYFYEHFLEVYDNALRKLTGSYYTPPEVVTAMVRLVDDVLRGPHHFGLSDGLASTEVTLADPAAGTGTYLLGVLRRIAELVSADQGQGAIPGVIKSALDRLIGFEMQFGPFAVAQLRLIAEVADLLKAPTVPTDVHLRLYVTNTLGNPDEESEYIPQILKPLADSRRLANKIKRQEPITVVIGNPPYKERAGGKGGWIEAGSANTTAPLDRWIPPVSWGVGVHTKHLRNLYIYFWRWATWKVFGDGASSPRTSPDRKGVVCFITVAGFLNGPGFEAMRDDLRRTVDEIWIVDCAPDGHQPSVSTRIFQGVQQPVCIVLAARMGESDPNKPARARFRSLPTGAREKKFAALSKLTLDGTDWADCSNEWRAPFLPAATGGWATYPSLETFFDYNGSGIKPGRTWVIAPDRRSLELRWDQLLAEKRPAIKEQLFHPQLRHGKLAARHINKIVHEHLGKHQTPAITIANSSGKVSPAVRYAFRSFDRQWLIADARLINDPRPELWNAYSDQQIYLTALSRTSPSNGPAITFAADFPDNDHYKGSFAGRVFPLWADSGNTRPNIRQSVLSKVTDTIAMPVFPQDLLAYIAAVAAHPAYTARFAPDLVQPGLRIPITADPKLFNEAAALGREVIWLHTFGDRFASPKEGRPAGPPRLPPAERPQVPAKGAIPSSADEMPGTITYDAANQRLNIGTGYIDNVPPAVWTYEVSGKQVLTQWFSYRGRDRSRPIIGDRRPPSPLGDIQPQGWLAEYTTELLNVLNVLGLLIKLEPKQADLLKRVCAGPTVSAKDFKAVASTDAAPPAKKAPKKRNAKQGELLG